MKGRILYLFLSVFLIAGQLPAQTPSFNFRQLGSEDKLNNANIFSIEQHPNGVMYFTTQNGVYYYDGTIFNKLSIDSLKTNALQNISIQNYEDIYISVRGEGVANFNMRTKKYNLVPQLKFKNNSDQFIITDRFAYFLNPGVEVISIDVKTGQVYKDEKRNADKVTISQAYCILKTTGNKILIGRSDGLFEIEGAQQKKIDILNNRPVHSITQTSDGKLVIGSASEILIVSNNSIEKEIVPKYKKVATFALQGERPVEKIVADNYGRIWFSAFPGDNLYLYQNGMVYDIFETLDIPPTLIRCLYKDKQENIWVGTFSEGAYYIQNPLFNSLNFMFNEKVLNVNSVYLKNNLLVAGTSNGLFGLNLNNNQTKILSSPDNILVEPIGTINEANNILFYCKKNESDMKTSMFADSKYTYRFKPIIASQFYPLENGQMILADRYQNIVLANQSTGIVTSTLISFPYYQIAVNDFLKNNDSLIIATNSGLFVYDFKTGKYNQVVRSDLNYNINDIAIINGQLFAAHEAGITNVSNKQLIQKLGNLPLNSVKKIKQFNDRIWLATLDGVYICDNKWQPLKVINKTSGLLSNSINDIVFNDESVCIATARGVAVANINFILNESSKLNPVDISSVELKDDTLVMVNKTISLNSGQDDIFIRFTSPLFSKPNTQYYRFRMDDGEWNPFYQNSLQTSITAGGKHKLEISVSVDNITWSDSTVLNINKEAKLKESTWLYWLIVLAGLTVISVISFFIIKRVKANAKKRLQEEQQVNLLKHQAMNALLSPHFIFNSLTSIQNYINTNNSLKASEYLAKFSRLIRMIIEKAAQSDITLHDELSRLTYYLELEKERFKNKFDFEIHVDPNLSRTEIKIPNMIIQPHVENCIIHGILPKLEHGSLDISFRKTNNNKLLITIEDDGVGLIKAKEHAKTGHKSLGTSTIKSILEINSKLSGKNQYVSMVDKSTLTPPAQGTLITIEIEL